MKRNSKLFILVLSLFVLQTVFLASLSPAKAGVSAAGTVGNFADMDNEILENSWISINVEDLTLDAEFIITATSGSGIDNITFQSGASDSTKEFTRVVKRPSSGIVTLTLYGYDTATAVATGSALDTFLVTVSPKETYTDTTIFTDYIGMFVVVFILVGITVLFRKKVL